MTSPADCVDRLRIALDRLAGALASGDPDAVLACELPVADALRGLRGTARTVTAGEADRVRSLVSDARAALLRCRRLGETVVAIAAATANAPQGYGRLGTPVPARARTTVTSRT